MLENYKGNPAQFDEAAHASGALREAYRPFVNSMPQMSAADFKQRHETARRIIQEQGVTYNLYGDPRGMERPWELDLLPLMLTAVEWRGIEAALIQRATLINLILGDCYGAQKLIHHGWLPPALVFAQVVFRVRVMGLARRGTRFFTFTPRTSPVRRTANGGSFPIARKSRPAWATRWRARRSPSAFCRRRFATAVRNAWRIFFASSKTRLRAWRSRRS